MWNVGPLSISFILESRSGPTRQYCKMWLAPHRALTVTLITKEFHRLQRLKDEVEEGFREIVGDKYGRTAPITHRCAHGNGPRLTSWPLPRAAAATNPWRQTGTRQEKRGLKNRGGVELLLLLLNDTTVELTKACLRNPSNSGWI